ncbi:hypothetical protein [Litoreibacter arenae]|uniref:Uncharacterized protein n=1 Tax=Litoreibacter arenae DSM 19593 TaxID=1123360 RepID=S9RRW8_9RHOB|nr:hypothetical protein [Litoreibacter arenae]EPX80800.1 hypothetical protein thalar_01020 [Litoreibacter arenae DSM 19593]
MKKDADLVEGVESDVDVYFAQARSEAPLPSAALLARIVEDARLAQAEILDASQPNPEVRLPWWRQFLNDIGGVPAAGGLVASACVGIYLGFLNPDFALGPGEASINEALETDVVMSAALLGDLYWIEEG